MRQNTKITFNCRELFILFTRVCYIRRIYFFRKLGIFCYYEYTIRTPVYFIYNGYEQYIIRTRVHIFFYIIFLIFKILRNNLFFNLLMIIPTLQIDQTSKRITRTIKIFILSLCCTNFFPPFYSLFFLIKQNLFQHLFFVFEIQRHLYHQLHAKYHHLPSTPLRYFE